MLISEKIKNFKRHLQGKGNDEKGNGKKSGNGK